MILIFIAFIFIYKLVFTKAVHRILILIKKVQKQSCYKGYSMVHIVFYISLLHDIIFLTQQGFGFFFNFNFGSVDYLKKYLISPDFNFYL